MKKDVQGRRMWRVWLVQGVVTMTGIDRVKRTPVKVTTGEERRDACESFSKGWLAQSWQTLNVGIKGRRGLWD